MAAVSVFVDDAIRGRLPLVCAKTGKPADLMVRMRQPVGSGLRSYAWVLVFFGPPGWLALLVVLMAAPAGEYLTVRIPQTQAAFDRDRLLSRLRVAALVAGLATLAYGALNPGMFPVMWLIAASGLLAVAAVLHSIVYFQTVGVSLDASRRWVTLSGVHPAFVAAVEARERLTTPAGR